MTDIGSAGTKNFDTHGLDPWYQNADRSTLVRRLTVESVGAILVPFQIFTSYLIIGPVEVFKKRISNALRKKKIEK